MEIPPELDSAEPVENTAGVGALLRASRIRRGDDLRDVSDELRIRYPYLEAIENNRFDELPGAIYASGFIRAYAEYLGLDGEEVVRRFKEAPETTITKQELTFPSAVPERSIPGGAILMVGVLIAAVGYGGWFFLTTQDRFATEVVPALPDRLAKSLPADSKVTAGTEPAAANAATPTPATAATPDLETAEAAPTEAAPTEAAPESAPQPTAAAPTETGPTAATPAAVETDASATASAEATPSEPPEAATTEIAETTEPAATVNRKQQPAAPQSDDAQAGATQAGSTRSDSPAANQETAAAPETPTEAPTASQPVAEVAPAAPAAAESTPRQADSAGPAAPVSVLAVAAPAVAAKADPLQAALDDTPPPSSDPASAAAPALPAASRTDETQAATGAARAQPATPAPGQSRQAEIAAVPAADKTPPALPSRIAVKAKIDSWIQVRDAAAGELIMTRVLRSGDTYAVPNRPGLTLSTGNAGALEILVDGTAVPAIGPIGAVRRAVALEADRLRQGTAVSE